MKARHFALLLTPFALAAAWVAQAHNAICSCYENGDETVTCEGPSGDQTPCMNP